MDRGKTNRLFHSHSFPLKNRLALTTGEGLGFHIACQALKKLGPKKNIQFLIWTHEEELNIPPFQTLVFKNARSALKSPFKEEELLQIKSSSTAMDWLKEAGEICLKREASALLTGPMSKKPLGRFLAGGQTDILKKLCRIKQAFMCFRGANFNVILWTDHIPLKKISFPKKDFKDFLALCLSARALLPKGQQDKPLGLLGLNPHAGEGGRMGDEEEMFLKPVLKQFSLKNICGPLPPDTAFLKKNWKHYSFYVALYHDQGLIPFKMAHSHKGFAQTLGLPFLRLGVSHGTGADLLKEKNISSFSFLSAIQEALRLIQQKTILKRNFY